LLSKAQSNILTKRPAVYSLRAVNIIRTTLVRF
jgi:hypothetical protein